MVPSSNTNDNQICDQARRKQVYSRSKDIHDVESILLATTHTSMLDPVMAEATAKLAILHPTYDTVAGQIEIACIRNVTPDKFSDSCKRLALIEYIDIMVEGACAPPYSYATLQDMQSNMLLRKNGALVERPEYAFMRVAIALYGQDAVRIVNTFEQILHQYYVLSPATMAHAGTVNGNMNSSYSVYLDSSIRPTSIFSSLQQTAAIAGAGGSIGVNLTIFYTGSVSFKHPVITGYLQPWHADVISVLDLIRTTALQVASNTLSVSLTFFATFEFDELHQMAYALPQISTKYLKPHNPLRGAKAACRSQQAIAIDSRPGRCLCRNATRIRISGGKRYLREDYGSYISASVTSSIHFARANGCYAQFGGSPMSRGLLNPDLNSHDDDSRFNWDRVRQDAATFGTANSVFTAIMTPGEVANIAGLTTTFGPVESMIQTCQSFGGTYKMIYPPLVEYLATINSWDEQIRQQILDGGGSIQHIRQIPRDVRDIFRNSWELGAEAVIDMAVSGAPYICQGQPLEIYTENPSIAKLTSTSQPQVAIRTAIPGHIFDMANTDVKSIPDMEITPPLEFVEVAGQASDHTSEGSDSDDESDDIYASDGDAEGDDELDPSSDSGNFSMFDPADFLDVDRVDDNGQVRLHVTAQKAIADISSDI
ncbi:hypothetical protein D9619_005164 [Psilocybe cf. subviscida]|uniref:Ribonucleoside-diphosphate reductase n=1 Tax=Psilocybe cf. subviscida TaxID=2480587 RepID=A0A8H5BWK5_9AGAR|nr:hypothetical protein D9619_005164 [Psilocybe cf. subviscida]